MKNHENQPETMKNHENQPRTMKNHENQPGTMKNQPGTMKNHEKPTWNHEKPTWNHEKPWKTMKNQPGTMKNHNHHWIWVSWAKWSFFVTDRQLLLYINHNLHHSHHHLWPRAFASISTFLLETLFQKKDKSRSGKGKIQQKTIHWALVHTNTQKERQIHKNTKGNTNT